MQRYTPAPGRGVGRKVSGGGGGGGGGVVRWDFAYIADLPYEFSGRKGEGHFVYDHVYIPLT